MLKSFRRTSQITFKRVLLVLVAGLAGFGILEIVSRTFNAPVTKPPIENFQSRRICNAKFVHGNQNTTFWGHVQGSCFWAAQCLGGSDGYVSMPMSFINFFTLPFPLFAGVLVVKKDAIDYMLPGVFGVAFDFGFGGIFALMVWIMIVTFTGFYVLRNYRSKRKNGSRMYLGREALLIGALSAFLSQSVIGLFLFNRTFNGAAMLVYIVLSALVMAHILSIKRNV